MKIYLLCIDAFPKTHNLENIAKSKGLQIRPLITNGTFTTITFNSIFLGGLPSDIVKGGMTWFSNRFPDIYEWRKQSNRPLDSQLQAQKVPMIIHNHVPWFIRNLLWYNFFPISSVDHYRKVVITNEDLEKMSKHPKYNHIKFTSTNPDGTHNVFREWADHDLCKKYYKSEKEYIKDIQSVKGHFFFMTDLCHWHESCYYENIDKITAIKRSEEWLSWWDFDEPDSIFMVFADHGYMVQKSCPPKDYLTWLFFKDNTSDKTIPRALSSSGDLYYYILKRFGISDVPRVEGFSSIDEPLNKNRIYLVEDARCSTGTNNLDTAVAAKIIEWNEDNTPKSLLQVTQTKNGGICGYFYDFGKNDPYKCNALYPEDYAKYKREINELREFISKRFNWIR